MTIKAVTVIPDHQLRIHGLEDEKDVNDVIVEQAAINNIPIEIFTVQELFIESLKLKPDIVFIDWNIPGSAMKGNQLTAVVKGINPSCIVIMITSHKKPEDITTFYYDLGGFCWIIKSYDYYVDATTLLSVIQNAIGKLLAKKDWEEAKEESIKHLEIREQVKQERENR